MTTRGMLAVAGGLIALAAIASVLPVASAWRAATIACLVALWAAGWLALEHHDRLRQQRCQPTPALAHLMSRDQHLLARWRFRDVGCIAEHRRTTTCSWMILPPPIVAVRAPAWFAGPPTIQATIPPAPDPGQAWHRESRA